MLEKEDIIKLNELFPDKEELRQVKEELKKDIFDFKSEILTGQDQILKELREMRQEKTVGDDQDKRKTKVLEIHNNALKGGKILSDQQASEIDNLRVF